MSAWLARRGARPVGIDLSREQLATARRLQQRHGLTFPLHEGSAEHLPFADESFDLAISEYGACLWADPLLWVPEAARVLRPGGRLIFLTNGTILTLCLRDDVDELPSDRLVRDYFGMRRFEWTGAPEVEFHLGYGDWIRLLRGNGFEVGDLLEVRPPAARGPSRPSTTSSPSSGRDAGPAKRSGRRASAPEGARARPWDRRCRPSPAQASVAFGRLG